VTATLNQTHTSGNVMDIVVHQEKEQEEEKEMKILWLPNKWKKVMEIPELMDKWKKIV
jgi:riboflavin synthase